MKNKKQQYNKLVLNWNTSQDIYLRFGYLAILASSIFLAFFSFWSIGYEYEYYSFFFGLLNNQGFKQGLIIWGFIGLGLGLVLNIPWIIVIIKMRKPWRIRKVIISFGVFLGFFYGGQIGYLAYTIALLYQVMAIVLVAVLGVFWISSWGILIYHYLYVQKANQKFLDLDYLRFKEVYSKNANLLGNFKPSQQRKG